MKVSTVQSSQEASSSSSPRGHQINLSQSPRLHPSDVGKPDVLPPDDVPASDPPRLLRSDSDIALAHLKSIGKLPPAEAAPTASVEAVELAFVTGGKGNAHRSDMQAVREAYRGKFPEARSAWIDIPVKEIVRGPEHQRKYDATKADRKLSQIEWAEKMKTPEIQEMYRQVRDFILRYKPMAICVNYDTISKVIFQVYRDLRVPIKDRARVTTHFSDFADQMHIDWVDEEFLDEESNDMVLTAGKAVQPGMSDQQQWVRELGLPVERTRYVFTPVSSEFKGIWKKSRAECRHELRTNYGIDLSEHKVNTLMISGTGHWPEGFIERATKLAQSDLMEKTQVTAVAGLKPTTKTALENLHPDMRVIGYIKDQRKLAHLIRAVDIIATKGGGSSNPRFFMARTAVLVFELLSGIEFGNGGFMEKNRVARVALTIEAFMKDLRNLVEHPEMRRAIEEAQSRLHIIEDSAEMIAAIAHEQALSQQQSLRRAITA